MSGRKVSPVLCLFVSTYYLQFIIHLFVKEKQ